LDCAAPGRTTSGPSPFQSAEAEPGDPFRCPPEGGPRRKRDADFQVGSSPEANVDLALSELPEEGIPILGM